MPFGHRRASLKDVAAIAKTSVATASRVLNNTGYISEDTRSRVLQAAESLNYQPNLQAKGLRRGSSRTVGLLIPNLLNAYYTALADEINRLLTEQGYQLLLSSTRDESEVELDTLRKMVGHDVDGLIWVPNAANPRLLGYLKDQSIPAVSIVRRVPGDVIDTVVFEDFAGSKAATQHLIQLGHTRIAYIGGDIKHSSNEERLQGFKAAMQQRDIIIDDDLVKIGTVRSTWGSAATNELLALPAPPTAIYVGSNAIIPGVINALRENNIIIPDEVSLVCFDDLDWFAYSCPPISAVACSREQMAEATVDLLINRIQEPLDASRIPTLLKISFELVVRESTAPPCRP